VTGTTLAYRDLRQSLRLSRAAQQMSIDLQRARIQAIALGSEQRLKLTIGAATYSLQRREPVDWIEATPPLSLPAGVHITACSAPGGIFRFTPRGNAASFGAITIGDSSGGTRQVIVNIAGRVRISP